MRPDTGRSAHLLLPTSYRAIDSKRRRRMQSAAVEAYLFDAFLDRVQRAYRFARDAGARARGRMSRPSGPSLQSTEYRYSGPPQP